MAVRDLGHSPARWMLLLLGVVLVLIGLAGLVPGAWDGVAESGGSATRFGGAVHLVLGLVHLGVAVAVRDETTVVRAAWALGIVYLATGVLGWVMPFGGTWRIDGTAHPLHVIVGALVVGAAAASGRALGRARPGGPPA